MKRKLTDRLLKSIQPPETGRIVVTDTERAGLRFRVTPSGQRTFLFEKKVKGGKRRAFTLGRYPDMSLAEARDAALKIETQARAGIDPIIAAQNDAKAREAELAQSKSVGDILELYIEQHVRRNLRAGQPREERERQLRTYLGPLMGIRIANMARSDIQRIVDGKAAEGKVTMANRLKSAICAFTAWATNRDYIDVDPGAKVQKAGREKSRTRTPSLEEVREIWAASFEMGDLWGPYIQLVILSGQRCRDEVLRMRWSWINWDKQRLEIPTSKNDKPHFVHLQDAAVEALRQRRRSLAEAGLPSDFVFTTTGTTAASGVSKMKARLNEAINRNRRENGITEPIEQWTWHDLRRSQATALAEAGFAEGIVDRIQNHVATGSRPSQVSAVYQLSEMLSERQKALDTWGQLVFGGVSLIGSGLASQND